MPASRLAELVAELVVEGWPSVAVALPLALSVFVPEPLTEVGAAVPDADADAEVTEDWLVPSLSESLLWNWLTTKSVMSFPYRWT